MRLTLLIHPDRVTIDNEVIPDTLIAVIALHSKIIVRGCNFLTVEYDNHFSYLLPTKVLLKHWNNL